MPQEYTPEGRQVVPNPDGTSSSEISITVTDPRINSGKPTNIPSMFLGQRWSDEAAIDIIAKHGGVDPETGRTLPAFDSIEEAEAAARARSDSLMSNMPKQGQKSMPDYRAALGRGSDSEMAHMTPGEAVIPRGSMTPKLWAAYQEALDRQGMAPEQYVVGSGQESINPATGQPEFLAQAAAPGRSVRDYQRDIAEPRESRGGERSIQIPQAGQLTPDMAYPRQAEATVLEERGVPQSDWQYQGGQFGNIETTDYSPLMKLLPGPLQAIGEMIDPDLTHEYFNPASPSTYGALRTSLGRESGNQAVGATMQGLSRNRAQQAISFMRPDAAIPPQFLGLSNAMSPLQQRTAIASRAVAGQGGQYTSPEAQSYYDNLLRRSLIGDGNELSELDTLLPIDLQYLAQVRGIENPADTQALLSALQ